MKFLNLISPENINLISFFWASLPFPTSLPYPFAPYSLSLRSQASGPSDSVCFLIESRSQHKVSEYNIRQLDLDAEHLDIPETDYDCVVRLPSHEFQRVCRDLSQVGDSVVVDCAKEGVSFAAQGDLGTGNIKLAQTSAERRDGDDAVDIELREKTRLTFALRYLNLFTKATPLSAKVI